MATKNLQYAAFETLINLCANNEENKRDLLLETRRLIEKEEDVLEELLEFTAVEDIYFFMNAGMADGWGPNEWIESETKNVLKSQYSNLQIEIPKAKNYEYTKFISVPVLKEYDNALRQHQLQFSHIDNEHYDFVCVIHRIADREKLLNAFQAIGCDFLEI